MGKGSNMSLSLGRITQRRRRRRRSQAGLMSWPGLAWPGSYPSRRSLWLGSGREWGTNEAESGGGGPFIARLLQRSASYNISR